ESLRIRFTQEYDRWLQLIGEGLRLILPPQTDIETESRILLSSIDGLLLQQLLGMGPVPIERVGRYFAGDRVAREHPSA
ncbi:MAG: hypothetical protein ACOC1I_05900, partial [Spirochaetota bacterium]